MTPRLAGQIPEEYWKLSPGWKNITENPAAAQFNHRCMALATAGHLLGIVGVALKTHRMIVLPAEAVRAFKMLGAMTIAQVSLGIAAILTHVHLHVGVVCVFFFFFVISTVVVVDTVAKGAPGRQFDAAVSAVVLPPHHSICRQIKMRILFSIFARQIAHVCSRRAQLAQQHTWAQGRKTTLFSSLAQTKHVSFSIIADEDDEEDDEDEDEDDGGESTMGIGGGCVLNRRSAVRWNGICCC